MLLLALSGCVPQNDNTSDAGSVEPDAPNPQDVSGPLAPDLDEDAPETGDVRSLPEAVPDEARSSESPALSDGLETGLAILAFEVARWIPETIEVDWRVVDWGPVTGPYYCSVVLTEEGTPPDDMSALSLTNIVYASRPGAGGVWSDTRSLSVPGFFPPGQYSIHFRCPNVARDDNNLTNNQVTYPHPISIP